MPRGPRQRLAVAAAVLVPLRGARVAVRVLGSGVRFITAAGVCAFYPRMAKGLGVLALMTWLPLSRLRGHSGRLPAVLSNTLQPVLGPFVAFGVSQWHCFHLCHYTTVAALVIAALRWALGWIYPPCT